MFFLRNVPIRQAKNKIYRNDRLTSSAQTLYIRKRKISMAGVVWLIVKKKKRT